MCTLAIYFQVSALFPLVIAANRDEFLARPTRGMVIEGDDPWVACGRDLIAGGTWLGVNEYDLAVGVLNRRTGVAADPSSRSRGLLCREALDERDASSALAGVIRDPATYNPYNLLIASPIAAHVVSEHGAVRRQVRLDPGLHLLTNSDLNDPTCPRIAKSVQLFQECAPLLDGDDLGPFRRAIRAVLADHSTPLDPRAEGLPTNLCVHRDQYGTRSSTIIAYSSHAGRVSVWYCDGPPCRTDYVEVTLPPRRSPGR